jgi:hypothetical protein
MQRMTVKCLEAKVAIINDMTDSPPEPYAKVDGKYAAQVGCYHLNGAYGGYELQRIMSDGGGVTCPLHTGHVPKRELAAALDAFIAGLRHAA